MPQIHNDCRYPSHTLLLVYAPSVQSLYEVWVLKATGKVSLHPK